MTVENFLRRRVPDGEAALFERSASITVNRHHGPGISTFQVIPMR